MKMSPEAATAWSDALSAPTSAEQGVEAMSEAEIAEGRQLVEDTRAATAEDEEGFAFVTPEALERLLDIASDHARLKAENAALVAEVAQQQRIAGEENGRANMLASIIRDCPEARDVWGKRILDEAEPHMPPDFETLKNERDELLSALRGVVAVADRDTPEFRRARAALQPAARPAGDETGGAK